MKTPRLALATALALLRFTLPAIEITNEVDIAALAAAAIDGECTTVNGWTLNSLDSYSDKKPNLRFNKAGEYALSPEFNAPITKFVVEVHSSATNKRCLAFWPKIDGVYSLENAVVWDYTPNKDTFVQQIAEWPNDTVASSFKIDFDDGGGDSHVRIKGMDYIKIENYLDFPKAIVPLFLVGE